MYKTLNFFLIGVSLMIAFFVFSNQQTAFVVQESYAPFRQPSMIPGAEAVRPVASNQTGRINDLMAELRVPPPGEAEPQPQAEATVPTPAEPQPADASLQE